LRILNSLYLWLAISGLIFLLWISRGDFSKLIKVFKILGSLFMKLLDLFFSLFNLKIERVKNFYDEAIENEI